MSDENILAEIFAVVYGQPYQDSDRLPFFKKLQEALVIYNAENPNDSISSGTLKKWQGKASHSDNLAGCVSFSHWRTRAFLLSYVEWEESKGKIPQTRKRQCIDLKVRLGADYDGMAPDKLDHQEKFIPAAAETFSPEEVLLLIKHAQPISDYLKAQDELLKRMKSAVDSGLSKELLEKIGNSARKRAEIPILALALPEQHS